MMHTTSTERNVVIPMETEESMRHEQTAEAANDVLKSLSPLINSIRPFGLYFTRKPCVPVRVGNTSKPSRRYIRGCYGWNPARIYATIVLVLSWFNALRNCIIFDGTETLGAYLFTKLGTIPGVLLIAILHTTYYIASHNESLEIIFRQMNSSTPGFSAKYRYSQKARAVTVISWLLISFGITAYTYFLFTREHYNDFSLWMIINTFHVSKLCENILKVISTMLQLQATASWAFAHAMNYTVVSFLYDQFDQLNDDFSKCIDDRGKFSGNFGQFRRRHQAISRLVQEADRFLMISNAANFCCQIACIIFVFYIVVFYLDDTVLLDPEYAVVPVSWLSLSVLGLLWTAGLAIHLNQTAHKLGDRINDIDIAGLDVKTVSEITLFVNHLNGERIGVSVLGIFVVDKNTILAVLALLVTYFVVVVQFANPSACMPPAVPPAVPTNYTTAPY